MNTPLYGDTGNTLWPVRHVQVDETRNGDASSGQSFQPVLLTTCTWCFDRSSGCRAEPNQRPLTFATHLRILFQLLAV
ncbi:MAG: hypothetical protein VB858_15740 [Planctomycetaceae bacterium]